jgi:hypothetical protein
MTNVYFENLRTRQDLTSGEIKAYQVYRFSPTEDFILDGFLWDKEVSDFVNTLRKAGVKSFVYTNTSTAVMDNFHALLENGCKFVEACTTEDGYKGLRFEV